MVGKRNARASEKSSSRGIRTHSWVASRTIFRQNLARSTGPIQGRNRVEERWLSGRKRRFAKSVNWETGSAGSNPVRSAFGFPESSLAPDRAVRRLTRPQPTRHGSLLTGGTRSCGNPASVEPFGRVTANAGRQIALAGLTLRHLGHSSRCFPICLSARSPCRSAARTIRIFGALPNPFQNRTATRSASTTTRLCRCRAPWQIGGRSFHSANFRHPAVRSQRGHVIRRQNLGILALREVVLELKDGGERSEVPIAQPLS